MFFILNSCFAPNTISTFGRIFGSVARNQATENSDLDFLIKFTEDPTLFDRFAVRYFLDDLFHCPIPFSS